MPIAYQRLILRHHLQANPTTLFLFGDNTARTGLGGQAGAMKSEPNAVGVATKWRPAQDDEAYFTDEDYLEATQIILADLQPVYEHLKQGGLVIWPMDGIGTGLSQLPQRAPQIWAFLEQARFELEGL
jgi:hypothetical protein